MRASDEMKVTEPRIFILNEKLDTDERHQLTFASLLISISSKPTLVSGWLVFTTARVSEPV